MQEEVRLRERVVAVDAEAVALCPYAARVPFQLQIVPRRPRARFEDDGPLGAALLLDVLGRLEAVLGGLPPLQPLGANRAPRRRRASAGGSTCSRGLRSSPGSSSGAGLNLNIVPPEHAAERLRDAAV